MMISPFKSPFFPDFSTTNFRESVFSSPPVTLLSLNIFGQKSWEVCDGAVLFAKIGIVVIV